MILEQRWPVRISAGQQSEDEELLLRAANLTLLAPAEPVAAAPICCRRDHGVFISDAYIQLMTPHVNAMLASPTSSPSADSASFGVALHRVVAELGVLQSNLACFRVRAMRSKLSK